MPFSLLILAALATLDGAPQQASAVASSTQPRSIRSQAQLMADYYPDLAQRMEKSGDASVRCTVTSSGGLTDCAVVTESPTGYGFGAATINVARHMQVAPSLHEGQTITIPISWRIPPSRSATAPAGAGN